MPQHKTKIDLARAYDVAATSKAYRVLVDRMWPRGIKKESLPVDLWMKEIAPSSDLRKWFGHDPERWDEFRKRYFQELEGKPDLVKELRKHPSLLLIYAAKDEDHNNAVALKEYLLKMK